MSLRFPLLLVAIAITSIATPAQSPSTSYPQTLVDFYMLLPDKYFEANQDQRLHWMLDPKRGAVVDVANGYLFAPGDGVQTDIYTCLFKRSDGSYLVAVGYNNKDEVFEPFLDFYIYDRGRLHKSRNP